MKKVKIATEIQTTACTVTTEPTWMLNGGAGYSTQQQRLLSDWVLNIVLTSRYMTASRLDFALPGREQEDKQRLNVDSGTSLQPT